jgi:alkylated DNA repair dioxygenase AlkB
MVWQPSLLGAATPRCDPTFAGAERRDLGSGAWLELASGWVDGADTLFETVLAAAPWGEHERHMYDRMVVEPRLTTRLWDDPPAPVLEMSEVLSERYGRSLHAISANLYRDGRDSVAWHGDRVGKLRDDTVVALVSLGSPRRFLLRPVAGAESSSGGAVDAGSSSPAQPASNAASPGLRPRAQALRLRPLPGDLLVLGGTAQSTWQHCVPKVRQAGPRISVMFREAY